MLANIPKFKRAEGTYIEPTAIKQLSSRRPHLRVPIQHHADAHLGLPGDFVPDGSSKVGGVYVFFEIFAAQTANRTNFMNSFSVVDATIAKVCINN
jgi:hypothetical protein